jgi:uncharacterized protein DUF2752
MVFRARRLDREGVDYELLWLTVSLATVALSAGWLACGLPWPRCMFLALTGHPCVTCGATRAAIQFFHGNFLAAWKWNPLAFGGLCAVSVFDIYAAVVVATRAPRLRIAHLTSVEKNFARVLVVALCALNWIYLLSHARNYS